MAFFSTTLTTDTVVQNLMLNRPGITNVKQLNVTIRTMGTASYVAFGGVDSQDKRKTVAGDGFSISPAGEEEFINAAGIFVISDANDAVLEIFGEA